MRRLLKQLRLKVRANRIKRVVSNRGYELHFDSPTAAVNSPYALLIGVVFVPVGVKIESPEIKSGKVSSIKVLLHDRPDLKRDLKGFDSIGFSAILENTQDQLRSDCTFVFKAGGKRFESGFNVDFQEKKYGTFLNHKKEKLHRIQAILQCPQCSKEVQIGQLICASCQRSHVENERNLDFRTELLRNEIDTSKAGNISAHDYDQKAVRIIEKYPDGLILDNGSGLRKTYYKNVVNFEIADYPTTDILGTGEQLPFKNESFDAVFSLSVLEHVKDPFTCVSEIMRVLKPGGDLFIAVPFLQPFHGYPNHYYNMTSSGLKNLFEGVAEISEVGVSKAGHPFWSLQWFLSSYANGLSEKESNEFKNLRISDIISPSADLEAKMLTQLDDSKRDELASFNFLLGKKPK